MEIVVYCTHKFEKDFLVSAIAGKHNVKYLEVPLTKETVDLSTDADAIALFVNDDASEEVLVKLKANGIKFIALRSFESCTRIRHFSSSCTGIFSLCSC
jgi:D-lactate dehydrogenase